MPTKNSTTENRNEYPLNYEPLYKYCSNATFIVDINTGNYLDANPAALEFTGCSLKTIQSKNARELFPDDAPDWTAMVKESSTPSDFGEIIYTRPDGSKRHAKLASVPIDEHRAFFIATDITVRKKAEKTLRVSEKRYRNLADLLPQAVWEVDKNGRFTYFNQAASTSFGWDEAELEKGLFVKDVIAPVDQPRIFSNIQRILQNKKRIGGNEYICRRKDGTEFATLIYSEPIREEETEAVIRGITLDITKLKQTEQELRDSEKRFKALHDASFGGIFIHKKGHILECNHGLSSMMGYDPEELIGMNGILLVTEEYRDLVLEKIRTKAEEPYEAQALKKNGDEFLARIESRNIPYKGEIVRTTEFRDITAEKQAKQQQQQLQEQLNQSQKMEAVGQLAGGIAHDFNNLLQAILGYGDLARMELTEADSLYECIDEILKATHKAKTLVAQLLAYSRRQVLEMQVVDINSSIQDMLNMLRRIIGEHIELIINQEPDLGVIQADNGQIHQILTNLCVNARDAMPTGGTLTIETQNIHLDAEFCANHAWAEPGAYIQLSVSDTGYGMNEEVQTRVFEPFFTTKEVGKGTGLGLSTVYGLVQQHEGLIHITSEENSGTTIDIYLPSIHASCTNSGDDQQGPQLEGTETILLAEDDRAVRSLTKLSLEKSGYTVLTADNGEDAIEVFQNHPAEIDLLLFDVMMPKRSGREAYEHIRQFCPDIKVLFASGYCMNSIHDCFVLKQGFQLIQKPSNREDLLNKVRSVLDGTQSPPP